LKWLLFKLAFFYPKLYAFFCYYRKRGRRNEIEEKFDFFLKKGWTSEEKKKIVRHIFELRGSRKIMHYLIPLMNNRVINEFFKIEGLHHVDQALKEGRGVVLMAAHLGNPHLAFCALRVIGYDLILIKGGAPKKAEHRQFRYRETTEDTIFIDDSVLAATYKEMILKTLRAGKVIHYYGDTREGRAKEKILFLGREMDFATGMIHLAHQARAAIIPCIHLYQKGRIALIFREPIDHHWERGVDEYKGIVSEFAKLVESYILHYPEQYMGIYGPTVLAHYYRSHQNGAMPMGEG
jgi:KDO2-lipid IV(A) lauroyltransferase